MKAKAPMSVLYLYEGKAKELLEDICNLAGHTIEEVKSKSRKHKLVMLRATFSVICTEQFPDLPVLFIAGLINRGTQILYWNYPMLIDKDLEVREYYLRMKSLLNLLIKEE